MEKPTTEEAKGFDIFNPKYVIGIYFLISTVIMLMRFFDENTNGYFLTALGIINILFVLITSWNERYLSWALLFGAFVFFLLNFLNLTDDKISMWNDILSIVVFNFTIIWVLILNKKRIEEKKQKDLILKGPNGGIYQALEEHLQSEWFHDMSLEQRKKFWDAIHSLNYPGAPREDDYKK